MNRPCISTVLVFAAIALSSGSLSASDIARAVPAVPVVPTVNAAPGVFVAKACYCRDSSGGEVKVGETACLVINGKSYLALCDMAKSQNNTTWRRQQEGCEPAAPVSLYDRLLGRVLARG